MKTKEEGLLATLAVLGIAALVAYLFPDHSLPAAGPRASSDSAMPPGKILDPGRGRHAVSPTGIPGKGWKDILWRTYDQINEDRLLAVAAGVVFYGLLALFPAITAVCTENLVWVDDVMESPNWRNDWTVSFRSGHLGPAVQVEVAA
jgi:membrane protein